MTKNPPREPIKAAKFLLDAVIGKSETTSSYKKKSNKQVLVKKSSTQIK